MKTLLEVKNLKIELCLKNNQQIIIKDSNIKIEYGKITALIGRSGEGKTVFSLSLVNLLSNKFKISEGEIIFNKKKFDLSELNTLRGSNIFYIPQNSLLSLNPVLKIKKQVDEVRKISDKEMMNIFKYLGLNEYERILNSYPFELSGGQAQRVVITIGLSMNPKLLIFDEPTSSLDEKNRNAFGRLMKSIVEKYNKSILIISHNLEFVKKYSDKIYEIKNKEIRLSE